MPPKRKRSPSVEFISWRRVAAPPFNEPRPDNFIIRTPHNANFHGPLTLEVPESQTTIETILRLTYPVPDPIMLDLDDVTDAYIAATKYKLNVAIQALQKMFTLPRFVEREPIRVYAIAVRFGLEEETNLAAFYACKISVESWHACEELDYITGLQYHALFAYHRSRGTEAVRLLAATDFGEAKCRSCMTKWSEVYERNATDTLHTAPTDDRVFSLEFAAEVSKHMGCVKCINSLYQALGPYGALETLKQAVLSTSFKVVQSFTN